jgi:hypothetical protein
MRLLAVIGSELMGTDERSDWGLLDSLVAANSPASIEVRVMALVNRPRSSMFWMPLGRAVGARAGAGASGPSGGTYNPSDSARQRLDRALGHLRALGLEASGDIEPGDAYRAVRSEAARNDYARVLFLVRERPSWLSRLADRSVAARLRLSLDIPVDVPGRPDLAPPPSDGG